MVAVSPCSVTLAGVVKPEEVRTIAAIVITVAVALIAFMIFPLSSEEVSSLLMNQAYIQKVPRASPKPKYFERFFRKGFWPL
jgi:hypothetical protein